MRKKIRRFYPVFCDSCRETKVSPTTPSLIPEKSREPNPGNLRFPWTNPPLDEPSLGRDKHKINLLYLLTVQTHM